MFRIIFDYLVELADYNYREAYWQEVANSRFNLFNLSMMIFEDEQKSRN